MHSNHKKLYNKNKNKKMHEDLLITTITYAASCLAASFCQLV